MPLTKREIQAHYLAIQQAIGCLMNEATPQDRKQLMDLSVKLLRIKRNMIGTFDELKTEALEL